MLGETGCVCDRADRESSGLVQHVERTLVARCYCGQDDTRLPLETFRKTGYVSLHGRNINNDLLCRHRLGALSSLDCPDLRDSRELR